MQMTRKSTRVLSFVLGASALFVCTPVFAQSDPINSDIISGYGLRDLENAVIIRATPTTPGAGETVHLTAEGPIHDLPKDLITWTINGKRVASGIGASSVDATVDAKGDPLEISVSVVDPVWGLAASDLTLVPLQLDILYDAPSYVPPFYRGRALPGGGGSLRVEALARFTKNGALIPSSSITYTWSRNGIVLGSISGLGKSKVIIDSPAMYGTDTISVRASAEDDTLSAEARVAIPSAVPVLALYEDHPLSGIQYFSALPPEISSGSEVTVAAVPYFATVSSLRDASLQFSWLLDGAPVSASSTKRNELTVNNDIESSTLHLDVTSLRNFFLSAAGEWKFIFGNSGHSINTAPGEKDAFHNGQP